MTVSGIVAILTGQEKLKVDRHVDNNASAVIYIPGIQLPQF
jgi:hypothetical protein